MSDVNHSVRNPDLLDASRSLLLVIDMQDKLLATLECSTKLVWNVDRLLRGARVLGVPMLATEQYPQRLGPTAEILAAQSGQPVGKRMFSCRECLPAIEQRLPDDRPQIVVAGIESHVCVLQTVLDLLQHWSVFVVADAISGRHQRDEQLAIDRMRGAGATLTTVEAVLFEWCEDSRHPEFKTISRIVQESTPINEGRPHS